MLPLLKLVFRGYQKRLPAYRPADTCDMAELAQIGLPDRLALVSEPTWRGYTVEGFSFESPVACTCPENRHVSGRLLLSAQRAPWVIIIPGYSTGALPPYQYGFFQDVQGLSVLQQGLNVVLIDLPFHRNRRRAGYGSGEGFLTPDLAETMGAFRQGTADVIALVRWLQNRYDRPVGLWGTSLGGNVAGLAATRLPDLGAVVLMEPLDNPGDAMAVLPGSQEIRDALAAAGLPPTILPEALRPVAPSTYVPAVPLERILFVSPLWDRVVPYHFQEAFWEAWGRPERLVVEASHTTLAARASVCARAAAFLAGFMNPPIH